MNSKVVKFMKGSKLMNFAFAIMIMAVSFSIISVSCFASIEEVNASIDSANATIEELRAVVDDCGKDMSIAHDMANNARQLELAEDSAVILEAKKIWSNAEAEKVKAEEQILIKQSELAALEEQRAIILADIAKAEEEARKAEEAKNSKGRYIGDFRLTGYCPCASCCGSYGNATATGVMPKEGVTIAVDPRVIPYGTKVYIEGVGYRIAQDCGGAIKQKKIDVFVSNHSACFAPNINTTAAVYIVE